MLHRSPREFGRQRSLWTLSMAAEVAFEEGIMQRRVSVKGVFLAQAYAAFRDLQRLREVAFSLVQPHQQLVTHHAEKLALLVLCYVRMGFYESYVQPAETLYLLKEREILQMVVL